MKKKLTLSVNKNITDPIKAHLKNLSASKSLSGLIEELLIKYAIKNSIVIKK